MTAQEMWRSFGKAGSWRAWAFGEDADALAALVLEGKKTATSSAYPLYALDAEPLPRVGECSVILDSRGEAVCVVQVTGVSILPFCRVTAAHAAREGEGDGSLAYWRATHRVFFTRELEGRGLAFDEAVKVVCEEFCRVFPAEDDRGESGF